MIRFLGDLPFKCTVAFSGGVDSVAVTDFLLNGKRNVHLAFFDHGTQTSKEARNFVEQFSADRGLKLDVGRIKRDKRKDESLEEYWRNERYSFFSQFENVVTAHHLDDAVETWIFTSLHGESKLIPVSNGNVIRPFLITPKSEMIAWCNRRNLQWVEDRSNLDVHHPRNRIRHNIVPQALLINPGLHKVVKKKYLLQEYSKNIKGWNTEQFYTNNL